MYKLLVLSLLGVINISVGQILQDGQCDPNIPLLENFDISNFTGTWYEIRSTDTELAADCSTIEFTDSEAATTVSYYVVRDNFYQDYHGQASVEANTARLSLILPSLSSNPINFWVLNTDYTNFALTYGCEDVGTTQRRVYIWQLSRENSFPTTLIPANMNTLMENLLNITNSDLREVSHSEDACYILPVITPGESVILPGQCNQNITGVANFQPARFLGVWHQIQSYFSNGSDGSCSRAEYSDGGDRINVVNSQIRNRTLSTIEGFANVISNDSSGQLSVMLEVGPDIFAESELLVLGTDYTQWAVTYTCNNLDNNTRQIFSWVTSRTRTLTSTAQTEVNEVINSMVELNNLYYTTTDQSDTSCFYIPETVGSTVVFGGQCDTDIAVVSNFSAEDYMGLWHDIERYPTPFQSGVCNNAFYTLGDDGVDVLNTQVLNEQLSTINGVALQVADGKLVISFPVQNSNLTRETDYWVISTDYSNYSLVYSCRNINDYEQQVSFWKLSRTKQLSDEAHAEINAVMSTLDIFNQDYFQPTNQSAEACFYYPEPKPGVPVRFPGSCETNIPVVPNFDTDLFQGEWFEIEAYPKVPQEGQCVNHVFTNGTDSAALNFDSSSVDDQTLGSTNGQLNFYAGETGGRFTLSFVSNGTTISFPYYVLATDYTDYALVYSCLDIPDTDFRGIWAWKLSRSKQLSENGTIQINNALASNISVVLSNDYFEPIDQSDNACFYMPDLAPGEAVIFPGQCDTDISVVQNFDATRYMGRWRLIEHYPAANQRGQCNQATYSEGPDESMLVNNNEVLNQGLRQINGVATYAGNEGILNVTIRNSMYQLWILDTDYDSYSIVYGCRNLNDQQRRVQSWKLSRTTSLTPTAIAAIDAVISNITVLNERYYLTVNHSDEACFYYPTPGNEPVTFRGQCDSNIQVVTGFDANAYMGLWYDIERYPSSFQSGVCNNALYTLGDDGVDVFNTQVLNEQLFTINGVAEQVADGKLVFSFPVQNSNLTRETDYWILSTDYSNYSLVYSCRNINEEERQVNFWKLSRTKQLSDEAHAEINAVMSTLDILNQDYFQPTNQSAEACFYYPEPQPGVPVRFPGSCETNIPVVPNFDTDLFQGEWFEVEAYPKVPQEGQCVNHVFTNGTGSAALNFDSSSVDDQTLGSTNGQLNFYAGESGGRFTLSFVSNGTTISFPYYVLATDYTDYALVYSCLDIPDTDFRGIWAWKLSRSKQLSDNGTIQINNALASNISVVLSNDYFEPIDQSDNACFYLPDLAPGELVVMPGQCDTDLSVIQNFNVTRYLGRWRLIENYPAGNQNGQCNQASYLEGPDGNILVYHNEVANQNLREINGFATFASNEGKLNVTFPSATDPYELWILDTDYETYSIVYGCTNINDRQRRVQSWKLSRTTSLTPAAIAAIDAVISNITVLNDRYYLNVNQSDEACFYYPTPGNAPVVYRGQCDPNITVVTGFDAEAYMGLWYDIERYPSSFQSGVCNNALYTLGDDGVDVFNTQVLNEQLFTINGVAEQVADGKLVFSFPVQNSNLTRETDYWILSTDYSNYSLVYSCRNINEEERQVNFWKLSRTKQLSDEAHAEINAVMSTLDILNQDYFQPTNQSAEACFYYPEPQPGVPVRFPGSCETDIPVVPNFDTNLFQGEWFEVEAYPKVPQEGQCVNHVFTNGTGSAALNFDSSSVDDQTLGSTNGQLNFYAGETGGRFTLSFVSNGTTISFPYYVLATDYTDYALVYSCLDIPDTDFRGIWAWKLSRSKQLSDNGTIQINNALASNISVVLSNDYFEPIDQSDNACFYLPDLAPGELVVMPGQCDTDLSVVQNFNVTRYLGRWRLIENYPAGNQNGQCNQASYLEGPDGNILVYHNEVANQNLREINGFATFASNEGKLNVTFPSATDPYELWILDTDYETYSIVYGCTNINDRQRRVQSWKLSRTTSLTPAAIAAIDAVISNITVLNDRYYLNVNQSDEACFYYPTPGNAPVVYRGQCDPNITVVTGFDAEAYMGLWYDIERYPSSFQSGVCNNALYTLGDDGVDVFNTQVLNEQLFSINGVAVQVADGKLVFSFPVQNSNLTRETDYWILSTDYSNYSLVYSCRNINEEERQVNFWKLSRTKQLSDEAHAEINAVMSTLDILNQDYFQPTNQSAEACFYYPEPKPGVPVRFPGSCETDIPVVPNFDTNLFQGEWFEVEAYPKVPQEGQCVNHVFTNGTGSAALNFDSSSVDDQTLGSTNGQLNFYAGETGGRFTLSFVSNGTTISFPYYVLATDYTDYALVYSCLDIPDTDFRGIWAWKLSRSKQLSENGTIQINNALASNISVVLSNDYFEPIDQSDNACFYLPDLAPGELVVMPGQCDTDLSVVQNFNVTRYLGRWRLIENYPAANQNGQCNQATYSEGSDGNILVYHNEVANQNLREMNGFATFASNEGKLNVTFPSATDPYELWILDTDYETYSIVYGCTNLNDRQRRVQSWKLSRTTSLTPTAIAAIDAVISNITVLNDRYYLNVNQSDEACFYYPTPGNSSVVFRGQCDNSISVVPEFDAGNYTGIWHSIESYPAPFQGGTCGKASYVLDEVTGLVLVENTQVLNQVLDVQTGFAEVIDNAKLAVTFEVNGFNITTDYWILATDYTSYSLVYSCRNIDDEHRQVGLQAPFTSLLCSKVSSWKLSRNRTLSADAESLINAAISNVQVLDQQYFVEEGQSDDDCFFYPDNDGGNVVLEGECPSAEEVPAVTNFNATLFTGIWHEVARFPIPDLIEGECAAANFVLGAENSINITQTVVDDEFQSSYTIPASISSDGRGVLNATTVAGVPFDALYILDTDYQEYALIYGCREVQNNTKQIYSWKLARSRAGLSSDANSIINQVVNNNIDLFEGYYSYTKQTNDVCFHYPNVEDLPEVVELPGPCDESIQGVQNFNATAYIGLWMEIERYREINQFGACDRAFYSPGDGNVLVTNTQVVGDSLLEQFGSAVVSSTDGSGQLNITFNVNGITVLANYYILATDYEDYALVYSCRNVNDNRVVSSWKLSRTTSLSTQAQNAMNAVIQQTQGLNQQYYQNTSQSDEDCFYIPEFNPNSAPLFRGRCEAVSGVTNLDADKFAGWWHELESYSVDSSIGDCVSSRYSATSGGLQVVDSSVTNGTAAIVTGTVTVTNDGRLTRVLSNGVTEEIVVLATDYDNYALLYSCVDITVNGEDYRRVWSAKHSKSRELASVNVTAINDIIASNSVLHEQLYRQVDQTDEACFYYPEAGNQVILPGKCDLGIPVVENFDVARYGGTWYQIERYPQIHENGTSTCVGARYLLNSESGLVNVLNWEVIDGELVTIEGTANITSADGSARLEVTLPIQGTNVTVKTPLYVLTTDYDTYALAYSCNQVNSFERSIGAWKLSRERTLSVASIQAINLVVSREDRPELNAKYFFAVNHPEGCIEPSSSGNLVKSSIIVLLVCVVIQLLY